MLKQNLLSADVLAAAGADELSDFWISILPGRWVIATSMLSATNNVNRFAKRFLIFAAPPGEWTAS